MYLSIFLLKYVRSASYQHNTTDTNTVRHMKLPEVSLTLRPLIRKKVVPMPHSRSTSTSSDLNTQEVVQIEPLKEVTFIVVTPQT